MTGQLPDFSMVLETANLEMADLSNLRRTLDSVAAQDLDIHLAQEVLLVHGGDVPEELAAQLKRDYPWLQLFPVPAGTGYGQAKMAGARACTGELIVFFDSDCKYEPGWLRGLVTGLSKHPEVGVLGGETQMAPDTVLGMASSLLFTFDAHSNHKEFYEDERVNLNNAVYRRAVLLAHPIRSYPNVLAAGGVSTAMMTRDLRNNGIKVMRTPFSRSEHAPPNGFRHFFWRFLNMGYDGVNFYRLVAETEPGNSGKRTGIMRLLGKFVQLAWNRALNTVAKLAALLRARPRRWLLLPLSLPMFAFGLVLQVTGYLVGLFLPGAIPAIAPRSMKRGTSFDDRVQKTGCPDG